MYNSICNLFEYEDVGQKLELSEKQIVKQGNTINIANVSTCPRSRVKRHVFRNDEDTCDVQVHC